MLYFYICFSFFLGIIAGNFPLWHNILWLSAFIAIFTVLSFRRFFVKILVFFTAFLLGFSLIYHANSQRISAKNFMENLTNDFSEKYEISGMITKKLFQNNTKTTYRLQIHTLQTSEKIFQLQKSDDIGIFVNIPRNLTLNVGDTIRFQEKITPVYKNDTIDNFEKYVWMQKIYGKSSPFSFERITESTKNPFLETQKSVKNLIFNSFPQNIAALLLGITIGNTDLMTEEMKKDFQNASLTHILVVSGSNIAFLILFLEFFIKYIPLKKWGIYGIILSFLFLYGNLVGWEIPVIRATIMGIISYLAISEGWRINSVSFLFLLAIILSFFEPLSLLYDASFSLSFGATLGIIVFHSALFQFLQKYLKFSSLCTIISVTIAATLWSLPAIIFHFWAVSFLGIFANILIGGIMGILLFLSTFYILLAPFLSVNLLYAFWLPIYFLWEYIFFIADIFGKFELYTIPENIKIPLVATLCFAGFLYILHSEETKILRAE